MISPAMSALGLPRALVGPCSESSRLAQRLRTEIKDLERNAEGSWLAAHLREGHGKMALMALSIRIGKRGGRDQRKRDQADVRPGWASLDA